MIEKEMCTNIKTPPFLFTPKPSPPKSQESSRRGWTYMFCAPVGTHMCPHMCMHWLRDDCHFLEVAKQEESLDLATPRTAAYCLVLGEAGGSWGMRLEKKKWMEDKEELGMSCWEYLGEIRYIFLKKLGFIFQKKMSVWRGHLLYSLF